ncbi:MAG TPA: Holliday junction resolvase RuvX, partial [Thermomicrobiales bacterium]|nr:Holliday junction resolvase RuvX [Thermomicrobiales bacterium]
LGAVRVVVGLPTGLSGREGPQAASVRAFAAELADALGPERPVVFWDERLSSAIAEQSLAAAGHRRRARRDKIDAVAATVILQGGLDAQRHRRRRRGEIDA